MTRRKDIFENLDHKTLLIQASDVDIPFTRAKIVLADFRKIGIKKADRALAALGILAGMNKVLSPDMLDAALRERFRGKNLTRARNISTSHIMVTEKTHN